MPKRWRVGIIGCGWAGERHAQVLAKLKDRADLCATADIDPAFAQGKASAWHVPRWTDDHRQLLHTEILDAVSLCLPHSLHAPAAIAAARAGLHVLVEKPLATTLHEADAICRESAHWPDGLDRRLTCGQASPIRATKERKPLLAVLATYASMQRGKRVFLAEFERTGENPHTGGNSYGTER